MSKLTELAASLLKEGAVTKIIGYEEGNGKMRPFFCETAEEAGRLVCDNRCTHNLAVYLTKPELMGTGKVAVVANLATLRSIARLAIENQLKEERLVMLTVTEGGEVVRFEGFGDLNAYLEKNRLEAKQRDTELIAKLDAMTPDERWAFWQKELSKCFKCYACRAACPLCYCTQCIVEVNRPQWIQPWSAPLSNMEWQINRSMHMAGRCTGCGACSEACPLDIPIHLLTRKMGENIARDFQWVPGASTEGNVLSTFKPGDKENFIH